MGSLNKSGTKSILSYHHIHPAFVVVPVSLRLYTPEGWRLFLVFNQPSMGYAMIRPAGLCDVGFYKVAQCPHVTF